MEAQMYSLINSKQPNAKIVKKFTNKLLKIKNTTVMKK